MRNLFSATQVGANRAMDSMYLTARDQLSVERLSYHASYCAKWINIWPNIIYHRQTLRTAYLQAFNINLPIGSDINQ